MQNEISILLPHYLSIDVSDPLQNASFLMIGCFFAKRIPVNEKPDCLTV